MQTPCPGSCCTVNIHRSLLPHSQQHSQLKCPPAHRKSLVRPDNRQVRRTPPFCWRLLSLAVCRGGNAAAACTALSVDSDDPAVCLTAESHPLSAATALQPHGIHIILSCRSLCSHQVYSIPLTLRLPPPDMPSPAVCRDSTAVGTYLRLMARICSP
jgi:hypothetical protein